MTLTTLLTGAATSPVTAAYARLTEVFPGCAPRSSKRT